ncbi:MAG: FKBP-type peptidyl-prolyl cis-trans isomerase [Gammaproteobacteria bacterium]|nr:FKBP-type peptidyl-prolyl cis-trans isomerase [Gammaproteobacteria bacterium]
MTTDSIIKADSKITLRYAVSLADGTVIEEADDTPESIQLGQGEFINELEQKLYGMKAGDSDDIIIPALEALFGDYDESRIQKLDHSVFDDGEAPQQGHIIEFTLPNGSTVPGIIREITKENVMVDFNHPLCGRDIMFAVDIVTVENNEEA